MKKNTKQILSVLTVAGLSVTTLANNVESLVKAEENAKVTVETNQEVNKVNAEVLENEAGAVIRVSANSNIKNTKVTYSVDGAKSQVVTFGELKAGEVREVQVTLEDCNKVKSLPKTSAVSERVEFSAEVKCHVLKGNVSYEYDSNVDGIGGGVITPTKPSEPVQPTKPTKPAEPTTPVNPVQPVVPVEPSQPTKPVEPTTPVNPVQPVVPVEPTEPTTPSVNGLLPLDPSVIKDLTPILYDEHKNGNFEYKDTWYERAFDAEEIYIDDKNLEEGQYRLKEGGSPMVVKYSVRQVYVNGVHIDKYDMELDRVVKDEGTPRVYIRGTKKKVVEPTTPVEPTKPTTPTEPTTPTINNDIEKGMPANAKWTRAQLQAWGYQLGNISGNYDVDGDLGTFGSEDEMTKAVNAGLDNTFNTMTAEQLKDLPSGYSWYEGANGYRVSLYDGHGVHNA